MRMISIFPFVRFKVLVVVAITTYSCSHTSNESSSNENSSKNVRSRLIKQAGVSEMNSDKGKLNVTSFIECLKKGKPLSRFFDEKWVLVVHLDDRSSGATDGRAENLKQAQIDSLIKIKVFCDGEGWESKKEAKFYILDFSLKEKVEGWNRFEPMANEEEDANVVSIVGGGESDYIVAHFNSKGLIVKFEYRSEDPG